MKPLLVMLLIAASVHAQSIADIARKERDRQAKLRPTRVVTSTEVTKPEAVKIGTPAADQTKPVDAKAASSEPAKEAAKPQTPSAVDPVQVWNNQMNQIRTKIRALQDQEMSLQLQQNQATNELYAPVTDPATQQAAVAKLGQIQQQLADVRKSLDEAKKAFDALQLQGPPKK
jgi:chromosome segregation ATPase